MSYFDEVREPGDSIIYRVEIYKLVYDSEADEYSEDLAFCTGYRTLDEGRKYLGFIHEAVEHAADGWNTLTTAVIVMLNETKCIKSPSVFEWIFCQENVDKIGKTAAEVKEGEKNDDATTT